VVALRDVDPERPDLTGSAHRQSPLLVRFGLLVKIIV
jgi:hypothetical protein